MTLFGALVLAAVTVIATPTPAEKPQAAAAAAPADPADQISAYVHGLEKALLSQRQQFNAFARAVYEPYCGSHGQPTAIKLAGKGGPYPATVTCKDGTVLSVSGPGK